MELMPSSIAVQPCPHEHTVTSCSGGWHYSGGEVWDDVEEQVFCLDCNTVVFDSRWRLPVDATDE